MDTDDFLQLVKKWGTLRNFEDEPVPQESLEKILKAGKWSSSGANTQPWKIIVVKEEELKNEIGRVLADSQKEAKKYEDRFPYGSEEALKRRITSAPVLLIVCADTRFKNAYPEASDKDQILYVSLGIAIQNMMLAANSLNLALTWGTVESFARDNLHELLNVPSYVRILEVLQLGVPKKENPPNYRKSIEEFTHVNKMDDSKLLTGDEIKKMIKERKTPDIYSEFESE